MTEPGKRTAQEFYNQVWMKEHTERNGNWPIAFAEAYHAHAQQADAPKRGWPKCKWCHADLVKWASQAAKCPKCGAADFFEPSSPVPEAPPVQTCPTCGTDIRCIHGVLFRDKCEPCEAPDPPATEAQAAIPPRVFFGRPGQDIPARRNETLYLREDGQSIVIHHDEALLPLLGSELLNKIKAWAMGAEAQTKEAD